MNDSVQRGQNEKFLKKLNSHTAFGHKKLLMCAISNVKMIISNQCDLHFYECLTEYVALLNLRNVVWTR